MPYFSGQPYHCGAVSIGPPIPTAIHELALAADVRDAVVTALRNAPTQEDSTYFWVYKSQHPVGDIMLHDTNVVTGESLVGYHLFAIANRRRGIGKGALTLLQQHVVTTTSLTHLIIITNQDNLASQRLAQSCGFSYHGSARESSQLLVFRWDVSGRSSSHGK